MSFAKKCLTLRPAAACEPRRPARTLTDKRTMKEHGKARWRRHIRLESIAKPVMLSVMGTTISILLTFGSSRYLDHKKKLANGRQLAIMAIHDIDNTVDLFEGYADEEYQVSLKAQYLMEHIDTLERVGFDTLSTVFDYLLADNFVGQGYLLDDASEKVFLSNQEAWKNIDNATFIDKVQTFYSDRHDFYNYLSSSLEWRPPLDEQEFINRKISTPDYSFDIAAYLEELLRRDDIRYFISYSSLRQQLFSSTAQKWRNLSDECQFLMGISDGEKEEYIESRKRKGYPLREKQLVGEWRTQSKGSRDEILETCLAFRKDHTGTITKISYESSHMYIGNVVVSQTSQVTWKLQGDSVAVTFKPELVYTVDTTGISYRAELKPDILEYVDSWHQVNRKSQEEAREKGETTVNYGAFIDHSETKLQWSKVTQLPDGTEETSTLYLTKQNDE